MKKIKLLLKGLSCANCANKIENKVNNIKSVKEAVVNFATSTLTIEFSGEYKKEELINKVKE
ncbi:cation transporter, partial [Clostridium saudiense]|nr:cation transporter [Clostridium saudiense]